MGTQTYIIPPFVGSYSNDDNCGGITLATRPIVDAGGRTSGGHTVPPFVGSSPRVHTFTSVDGPGSKSQTLVLTIPDVFDEISAARLIGVPAGVFAGLQVRHHSTRTDLSRHGDDQYIGAFPYINVRKDRLEAGPVDCGECDLTIPAGHSESVECTVGIKKTDENLLLTPGLNTGAGSK